MVSSIWTGSNFHTMETFVAKESFFRQTLVVLFENIQKRRHTAKEMHVVSRNHGFKTLSKAAPKGVAIIRR